MDFINFTITENDSGRRLDKVTRRILPQMPLTAIYKHIRKGFIKLNQKRAKAETIVKTDDTIQVAAFLKEDISLQQQNKPAIKNPVISPAISIEDIFVNEHIRIINKPYDISVHGDSKEKTSLADIIAKDFFEKDKNQSLSFRPGPLHRLDRKTTGIIAFSTVDASFPAVCKDSFVPDKVFPSVRVIIHFIGSAFNATTSAISLGSSGKKEAFDLPV